MTDGKRELEMFVFCVSVFVLCFVGLGIFLADIAEQIKRIADHMNAPAKTKDDHDSILKSINESVAKLENSINPKS